MWFKVYKELPKNRITGLTSLNLVPWGGPWCVGVNCDPLRIGSAYSELAAINASSRRLTVLLRVDAALILGR